MNTERYKPEEEVEFSAENGKTITLDPSKKITVEGYVSPHF